MCRIKEFTLVELLVVVAVIGILLSLLLPSLGGAREKAIRAICASNQQQVYRTVTLYAKNNNFKFPEMKKKYGDAHLSWMSRKTFDLLTELTESFSSVVSCPNQKAHEKLTHKANVRFGYYFQFGHKPGGWQQALNSWDPPQTLMDDSSLVFSSDLVQKNTNWGKKGEAPHGYSGRVTGPMVNPKHFGSQGSNVTKLDGSTAWRSSAGMIIRKVNSSGKIKGYW